MFHYQLSINVEQTFNLFKFCILVDIRIRQIIRPMMDSGFHWGSHEHSPYQYICFVCLHWECGVAWWHSPSLLQKLKDLLVSQDWWWRNKFPWATGVRMFSLTTFCLELILPHAVSWMLVEHYLVDSLEKIRRLNLSRVAPISWMLVRHLSFIGIHWIDQRSPTSWRDVLAPRIARHQTWSRFGHRRAFVRSGLLTSFWHSALFSNLIVRKSLKWLQEYLEKLIMLHKRRKWFHASWQIVCHLFSWCQHVWFGSWVPNWFCQTTNQEQLLWAFWIHVSSLDFVSFFFSYHGFVVLKNVQLRLTLRRMCVCGYSLLPVNRPATHAFFGSQFGVRDGV